MSTLNNLTIIPYQETYWPAICRIHDLARTKELQLASLERAFLSLAVVAETEELFAYKHLDLALLDGEVVGFAAYSEEEMAWLYISPDHQGQGIGKQMVAHALQTEPGIYYLETLVGNLPAKHLYEGFGFVTKEILTGQLPGNESFTVQVYSMYRPLDQRRQLSQSNR